MDNQLFETIHRYLSGQMTDAEAGAFAAQIAADADLRAEVTTQEQIKTAYRISQHKTTLAALRTDLQATGQLWQPETALTEPAKIPALQPVLADPEPNRWLVPARFAMAASLLLAMGLGWYAWQNPPAPAGTTVANRGRDIPPTDTSRRTGTPRPAPRPAPVPLPAPGPAATAPTQVASRYERLFETNFDPTFRRTLTDNPLLTGPRPSPAALDRMPQDTLAVLRGIALLRRGKTKPAIATLTPATGCVLPDWQANARWFLALAYLRDNQPARARPLLNQLTVSQNQVYRAEAQTLLTELDRK